MAGGKDSFTAFRDLAQLLLQNTVMETGHAVRLTEKKDAAVPTQVLGGRGGPTRPVQLRDGRFLRVAASLYLDPHEGTTRLKVAQSSYQYQVGDSGNDWICRYDYLRQPGKDPHPLAHLQIHGSLTHDPGPAGVPLHHIHFPTGRTSLEAVIRLLVDQFKVPTKLPAEEWRPILACSEESFRVIAHQPESGPAK